MLNWIGKILASSFVQSEIKKIKDDLDGATKQVADARALKKQLALYADAILAEGQLTSKEKLDAWFIEQRAKIKVWAGE